MNFFITKYVVAFPILFLLNLESRLDIFLQHEQICSTFSAELIKAELLMQMNFDMDCQSFSKIIKDRHWRRLVKNIGWANQNIGVQKAVKSDKCMGISRLLGGTCPGCPLPPKVYASEDMSCCFVQEVKKKNVLTLSLYWLDQCCPTFLTPRAHTI